MDVKIKELKRTDFSKAITFAIKGMNFDKYIQNKLILRLYGRYFLYLELERATQVISAYIGNNLVGLLMADMKHKQKHPSSIWRKAYIYIFKSLMNFFVSDGADNYDEANKILLSEYLKTHSPDGEICFLAVDPTIHGKGIGTLLLKELSKQESKKLVFLYTDSNCTYQFYEQKGFTRSVEKRIEMELGKSKVPLTCLLYSKEL